MKNEITIYTDGACKGNPGIGGWGAVIKFSNNIEKRIYGYNNETTNNRMELTAAIMSLSILDEKSKVILYTDSKYLMDGINQWILKWKKNSWKTSNNKEVKNMDLWKKIDELNSYHSVEWNWVKGHSGNYGNDQADELANFAISNKDNQYD
mgnify:CR=1 FL=1|tara:strand:+ start:3070 stop:3522 length:453 start_codon:yes stop_codon:yes gene_type:complete